MAKCTIFITMEQTTSFIAMWFYFVADFCVPTFGKTIHYAFVQFLKIKKQNNFCLIEKIFTKRPNAVYFDFVKNKTFHKI